jgi:gluconate 2-dehydrogenase gamma chain
VPDRYTPEEFAELAKNWDSVEAHVVEQRLQGNFSRPQLEHFSPGEAALMRAVLKRLIPEDEGVDLAGFMDAYVEQPLGRGDRRPGMPGELELYKLGLQGIDQAATEMHGAAFGALSEEEQDAVLSAVSNGSAPGAIFREIPGDYFFERFYGKALHGYFAHPRVWMRIGFPGPAYPEGYGWLGKGETRMRHERQIGWDTL